MKTTAAIVEMLAIGCVSSIWIALTVIYFSPEIVSPSSQLSPDGRAWWALFSDNKEWVLLAALVASLLWYYLGWIVNGVCFKIAGLLSFDDKKADVAEEHGEKIPDEITDPKERRRRYRRNYEKMRARVYQDASSSLLAELDVDRAAMRIARTGAMNFLLIGLAFILFPALRWYSIFPFIFMLGSLWEAKRKGDRFYNEVGNTYTSLLGREAVDKKQCRLRYECPLLMDPFIPRP